MADYPLGSLGIQIRGHWKRHRPQMYAALQKSGHLLESVYAAQELTNDLMDDLLGQGMKHHEAWELAGRSSRVRRMPMGQRTPAHDLRDDARRRPPAPSPPSRSWSLTDRPLTPEVAPSAG